LCYNLGIYFPDVFMTQKQTHEISGKKKFLIFISVLFVCLILLTVGTYYVPKARQLILGDQRQVRPAALERGEIQGNIFVDVEGDHPNVVAIAYLKSKGVIQGYEDGSFKPDDLITRGQVMKLVVSALHVYPHRVRYSYCFDDVGGEWFASYVCFAKEKRWISGSGDNLFYPERNITGAEVLKIIANAYQVEGIKGEIGEGDPWYKPYIEYGESAGWLESLGSQTAFDPDAELTRGELGELLFRIMQTEVVE